MTPIEDLVVGCTALTTFVTVCVIALLTMQAIGGGHECGLFPILIAPGTRPEGAELAKLCALVERN